MFKKIGLVGFLFLFGSVAVYAEEAADDVSQGWSPAQANRWMDMQMSYAHAVQQYGATSPEATQAQVEMNTFARRMGITPSQEVPETTPIKRKEQPAEPDEEPAAPVSDGPALNSPAPENPS